MLYRVAGKALLSTLFKKEMLLPTQLGVNSKGGVEPALYLLVEAIEGPNSLGVTKISSWDQANAYNNHSRRSMASAVATYAPTFYKAVVWVYSTASLLITPDSHFLASAKSIRQGNPLGPFFFSLTFWPILKEL